MKRLLLRAVPILAWPLLAMTAPVAQAGVISIDDRSEQLSLFVNKFNQQTVVGDPTAPPGSGNLIDITTPTNSNGISNIQYNPTTETLSFKFANQINWGADSYFFSHFTDPSGKSDLLVVQGFGGTTPDYVTFISDPGSINSANVRTTSQSCRVRGLHP
jgi:hypothetical protein